jgi:UDP-N-acetylglucosamine 2-epimerase (non-hydrolysing)
MKVLSVVGARPQFVKALPVSEALRDPHEEIMVHTGQHYDDELCDVFFRELQLPSPDYNLGVGSDTHAVQTARIMESLEPVMHEESPDVTLVYGDTNSTLAAALVTAKMDPTLAHVEAGLRSGNWAMPEEVNRVLTDHAADLLFAPSQSADKNLQAEGLTDRVTLTGDVMYDALVRMRPQSREQSTILSELDVEVGRFILATVHRAGNTDDPNRLAAIVEGLAAARKPIVFPCHPRTETRLRAADLWRQARESFEVIDPVGYLDFIRLIDGAERVATDSGGVQKEAFFLDTPCVTLREETEWVETVDAGWNILVGAHSDRIATALSDPFTLSEKPSVYGDGTAARQVVRAISGHLASLDSVAD